MRLPSFSQVPPTLSFVSKSLGMMSQSHLLLLRYFAASCSTVLRSKEEAEGDWKRVQTLGGGREGLGAAHILWRKGLEVFPGIGNLRESRFPISETCLDVL